MILCVCAQVGLVDGSLGTILVHRVYVDLPIEIEWNTSAVCKLPDSGKHHLYYVETCKYMYFYRCSYMYSMVKWTGLYDCGLIQLSLVHLFLVC